jgi:hypothetical protein
VSAGTNIRSSEEWKKIADQLGLTFKNASFFSPPLLKGIYRMHKLKLFIRERGLYPSVKIDLLKTTRFYLNIYPKIGVRVITVAKGMKTIEIGNLLFDRLLKVEVNDESMAREVIDLTLQDKILTLKDPEKLIVSLSRSRLTCSLGSTWDNPEEIKPLLDILIDIAEKIEKKQGRFLL